MDRGEHSDRSSKRSESINKIMFSNLWKKINNFFRHLWPQATRSRVLLVVAVLAVVLVPMMVLGQTTPPTTGQIAVGGGFLGGTIDVIVWAIVHILLWLSNLCIQMSIFFLGFVITIAGYNNYLDSAAVNFGWVMVRDIANMGFVIVLLVIAFGTILGAEQYEWKRMLVKLVSAAVLVNFSRVICALIIDVAQVVMTTFLNGIAATAAGNLVNAFNLTKILQLSQQANVSDPSVFVAAAAGLGFTAMLMVTMGIICAILVMRVISLWILIVLSPIAFAVSALPQTEGYASEWWSQFNNNVMSGPLILFFLWLSFITVGNGDVIQNIQAGQSGNGIQSAGDQNNGLSAGGSAGVTQAMEWNSMAGYFIALGMLYIGIQKTQELGVYGSGMLSNAVDFAKSVATTATGVAAGMALYEKVGGVQGALEYAPGVGMAKRFGQSIYHRAELGLGKVGEWRNEKAKELEESWYKGGADGKGQTTFGSIGGKLLSSFIETRGRADKKVEDWKEAAERQHEIVEKEYSTSSAGGGVAKLATTARLKLVERKSEAKKEEKLQKAVAALQKEVTDDPNMKLLKDNAHEIEENKKVMEEAKKKEAEASKAGDAAGVQKAQAEFKAAEDKNKELKEAGKKIEKELSKKTAFATLKAEESGHVVHEESSLQENRLKEEFEHTAAGGEVLRRMEAAKGEIQAIQKRMSTAQVKMQLKLLQQKDNESWIKAQAASDAQDIAFAGWRQSMLSQERDRRASQSQEGMSAIEKEERERDGVEGEEELEARKKEAQIKSQALGVAEKKIAEIVAGNGSEKEKAERIKEAIRALPADLVGVFSELMQRDNKEVVSGAASKVEGERKKFDQTANPDEKSTEKITLKNKKEVDIGRIVAEQKKKIPERNKRIRDRIEAIARGEQKLPSKHGVAGGHGSEGGDHGHGDDIEVEIAAGFAETQKWQNQILENRTKGALQESVMQAVIGNKQGINFPNDAARKSLEPILSACKGMDRNQMLKALKDRTKAIADKLAKNETSEGKEGYRGSQEFRMDQVFTHALSQLIQTERFFDDPQGLAENTIINEVNKDFEDLIKVAKTQGRNGVVELEGLRDLFHQEGENAKKQSLYRSKERVRTGYTDFKQLLGRAGSDGQKEKVLKILKRVAGDKGISSLGNTWASASGKVGIASSLATAFREMGEVDTKDLSEEQIKSYIEAMALYQDSDPDFKASINSIN